MKKKLISLLLVFAMCLSLGTVAFAEDVTIPKEYEVVAYSEAFPDAYIEISVEEPLLSRGTSSENSLPQIVASVFVEESYDYDDEGNIIVTNSRLLSEEEVISLDGKIASAASYPITPDSNSYRKLDISLSGTQTANGSAPHTSNNVYLTATAAWSAAGFPLVQKAAPGEDAIAIFWSGGFEYVSSPGATLNIQYSNNIRVSNQRIDRAFPNGAIAWAFNETIGDNNEHYAKSIVSNNIHIRKNNMTGGGNGANIVFKYIHTYNTITGDISFGVTTDGSGVVDVTINERYAQWPLTVVVSGVYY